MQNSRDLTVPPATSLPPGHMQTPLKKNLHHTYTKDAEMWILAGSTWLVPDPFCGF